LRAEKNRDFQEIQEEAVLQGWAVERTGRGHWKFKSPNGSSVAIFAGSPGDWRTFKNFIAALRRGGFQPKGKSRG